MNLRSSIADTTVTLSRRSLLRYVGHAAAGVLSAPLLGPLARAEAAGKADASGAWVLPNGVADWTPIGYPIPIPGDGGTADTDARRLANYMVKDALLLPPGFRYNIVARWGDTFGAGENAIHFGYSNDYTGLAPVRDGPADEYWLLVNHEYISGRPWLQGWNEVLKPRFGASPVTPDGKIGTQLLTKLNINLRDESERKKLTADELAKVQTICKAALDDLGVSVLRVKRSQDGNFTVVKNASDHLRISALPETNKKLAEAGGMKFVGPAATLLGQPTGTFSNCSGAVTPWGTFLTCEENVQDQVLDYVAPNGAPLPGEVKRFGGAEQAVGEHPGGKLPFEFAGLGTGIEQPLDGRQFGWVCEVDPVARSLTKLTALGRFRHENVALRAEAGRKLVAYMGDDRRGGHLWKFVSNDEVTDPANPQTAKLLEKGTLYVARLEADFTGRWIALTPETPVAKPTPEDTADGVMWLPSRPAGGHVLVGTAAAAGAEMSVRQWQRQVERFTAKPLERTTLGDLVRGADPQAVIVTDAYAMANAAGGTPCARPEDVEVHPHDKSVYIAFSDTTGSKDGSPDKAAFPDSAKSNSRQYGAIYRLREDGDDPAATTFTWGRFVAAGEVADLGGGFACADNLVFDPDANLWMVCDITAPAHNFPVTRTKDDDSEPGDKNFLGLFGNNAMFMIPTTGPLAGVPHCFAIGPMECELTGPTFTPDGRTLILAVQHPGELYGARGDGEGRTPHVDRTLTLATRNGTRFEQKRRVPLGSNFPSTKLGAVPRPCVVCVTRS